MRIETASLEHLDSLTRLTVEFRDYLNGETPSEEEFRAGITRLMQSSDAEFFVIVNTENSVCGYILQRYRYSMWKTGTEARIEDLFVSQEHRRKDLGKALVAFAIKRAREKGCKTICLDTNENNTASTRIYSRFGFNSVSKNWNNGRQIFYRLTF